MNETDERTFFALDVTENMKSGKYTCYDNIGKLAKDIQAPINAIKAGLEKKKLIVGKREHKFYVTTDESEMWFIEEVL